MKFILALIIGIALGAAGFWLYTSEKGRAAVVTTAGHVESAARGAKDAAQGKLQVLDLRTEDIKEELNRTGQVVRRKAKEAGDAIADATADARATASIKTRLLASPDLSAMNISVNTTAGIVTLSGSVAKTEEISKAMLIAMETDNVREVISTLQVKSSQPTKAVATTNTPTPKRK